jgi:hypothetical protein
MFEQIEKLKREFTDKYVVVDEGRPELRRFKGMTGLIKTVNMSGRALVRFDADNNIGWYDIGLDFLKVVPKPEPKPEAEKPAKKAAPAAKAAEEKPAATAAAPKAAAPAGGEKKMSVAEMLRAQKAGSAAAAPAAPAAPKPGPAPAPEPEPVAEAAPVVEADPEPVVEAKPAAKPAAPAGEQKKLSTAEILAALRAKKS